MSSGPFATAAATTTAATPSAGSVRSHGGQDRAPRRRIMPPGHMLGTVLAILVGSGVLATLGVFLAAVGLAEAIAGVRWVLASLSGSAGAHVAVPLLPLLRVSVGSALILAPIASLAFMADLRRQRWL